MAEAGTLFKRFRELRARFNVAHTEGIRALRQGNFEQLGDAIRLEGEIIKEQGQVIDSLTHRIEENRRLRRPLAKAKEP